ncbi:MAG: CinA family nicotinamide mononucleotide deamidase-related protein [Pirellulales bacterium]|nr:CinA family nicotinamide mononucleotide deamidase-related protein [Pirellulales bacterium]
MNAETLAIGDEITSGQLLDTNSQWLSQRLGELGVRVLYHTTVGDELAAGVAVFRQAIDRADLVIATGGLGPTADDLTRGVLAEATGRRLVRNDAALAHIREIYARRRRDMPPRNEVQAMFPEGSRMVANPNGTAPGIAMEIARPGRGPCHVFALPGVPAEMKEMWAGSVRAALVDRGAGRRVVVHRNIKCFGAGESNVEAMLPDLVRRDRVPRVGITASRTTIILRITAEGATAAECEAAIAPTVATIHECLGDLVFGQDDEELEDVVVRLLTRRNRTLAVAEWGTAGLVAQWLALAAARATCRPKISPSKEALAEPVALDVNAPFNPFSGGIIVRDEQALVRALDVPWAVVAEHGAASAAVAEAMAQACRRRFGADYGLAVSQFPERDPASAEPPSVHFALATSEGVRPKSVPFAGHLATLAVFCAKHALDFARLELGAR